MSRKKGFKYPRLTILICIIFITYFVFSLEALPFASIVTTLGLIGAFVAGFFYAFSFTAFAATALLLFLAQSENILLIGLTAGGGSLAGDLLLYKTARVSFSEEFKYLYKEKWILVFIKPIPKFLRHFLKVLLAMIIIASPLPDEAGVALLANGYVLPSKIFSILSYILNTGGILLILYAGKVFM